jgi:serine/threonine protein kinase
MEAAAALLSRFCTIFPPLVLPMHTPVALLKFVARAALNAVGGGVAGDFAVEVVPDLARDVWLWWGKGRSEEQRREEVQELAQLPLSEVREQVEQVVAEEAGRQPEAVRRALTAYLCQVPSAIRQSQRRPADPSGRTLASGLALQKPEDLLSLLPARPPRFQPGDRPPGIGDWELEELLGVGGFGEVWKARNPHLAEPVALKFCLDPTAAKVLSNEAALLGRVLAMSRGHNPGIVRLLHTYLSAETPCLEYEYVPGGDLTGLIGRWQRGQKTAPFEQAARLICDLANIVGFAHRLDPPIVHRDLKPANVLLLPTPGSIVSLRVADFGIGGLAAKQSLRLSRSGGTSGQFLTKALRGACTPLYASPQQVRGEDPHPSDDVHALGVIWYQALTGDLTTGISADWRDELAERGVPEEHVTVLAACLSSRAEKRPPHAGALAERLQTLVKPPSSPTHPVAKITARPPQEPLDVIPVRPQQEEEILDVLPVDPPRPRKPVTQQRPLVELQPGQLITSVAPEEVFALLPEVMLQCGVTNLLPHRFSLTVEGTTGMDWVSFGQRVVAQVRSCSRGSLVTVKSQPHKLLQLYDWGRGKREAQTILQGLADRLASVRPD